ncbi:MAG: 50S ribosomal protein L13 [Candidatus Altiarchaeota archaeon]|nr:50S ribosomal protein L13 [Candidatus Altiarchaeota archaeon]
MIVDAEGKVLGRLCSFVAKKALLGENVIVVNAEKAVVSGDPDMVLGKEIRKLRIKNLGNPQHGPFHQKRPDRYVRRSIRGMLPWHKYRGREAFKRVMVYVGVPADELMKKHNINMNETRMEKLGEAGKDARGITVAEICRAVGGKF